MDVTEFKCRKCNCISKGKLEIKTDADKKEKWEQCQAERLELRAKQEIILKEFEAIVEEHNSHWYNISDWYVCHRPFEDYLDILNFTKDKPIKSVPYNSSVMDMWLNFIYKKPCCDYIECPVCNCKNYMDRC